jgi:hypothetical protein
MMKAGLPLVLALMACGDSEGVDALAERVLAAETEVAALREELAELRAHERTLAAEVAQDGLPADGVADDLPGFETQLAASRIDGLGAASLAALTGRVEAVEGAVADVEVTAASQGTAIGALQAGEAGLRGDLDDLLAHERALAAEVVGVSPVDDVLADFELQLADSRLDRIVADPGTIDLSAYARLDDLDALQAWVVAQGYLTDAALGPYALIADMEAGDAAERAWVTSQGFATTVQVSAGDAAERAWVVDQGYATTTQVSAGDAAERAWVVSQGYLTDAALGAYALISYVDAEDDAERAWVVDQGYLTDALLSAYALTSYVDAADAADRAWVTSQGFATTTQVSAGDAAERAWVVSQGYLTDADLAPYALTSYVDAGDAAAEAWVVSQGYATVDEVALGDAAVMDYVQQSLSAFTQVETTPLVIAVPGDAPDVRAALASLAGTTLVGDATATIRVDAGGCGATYTEPIVVDHPNGERIRVVSAAGDPDLCVLLFDTAEAGVQVRQGNRLGALSGFTLRNIGAAEVDGLYVGEGGALLDGSGLVVELWGRDGVSVQDGSYASLPGLVVRGNAEVGLNVGACSVAYADDGRAEGNGHWGYGASRNGWLQAESSAAEGSGAVGFYAYYGGGMRVANSAAYANGAGGEEGDGGFYASSGGVVDAASSWATGNDGAGFGAREGGILFANGSTTGDATGFDPAYTEIGNTRSGFVAEFGSYLNAERAIAHDNGLLGVQASYGSTVRAPFANATSNGGAGFASEWGSVVRAPSGTSHDNGDGIGGSGFHAANGAVIEAELSGATSNDTHGFHADRASFIGATGARAIDNSAAGFLAYEGSVIDADSGTATDNRSGIGFESSSQSLVTARSARSDRNDVGFFADANSMVNASTCTANSNTRWGFAVDDSGFLYASGVVVETTNGVSDFREATNTLLGDGSYLLR